MKKDLRKNHHILLEITKIEECDHKYILCTISGSTLVFSKHYYFLDKHENTLKLKDGKGLSIKIVQN
jgi:hypothetical protein